MTESESKSSEVLFDRAGVLLGLRGSVPVALGLIPFGLAFGVLARQSGVPFVETFLMSVVVFAGAAQFAALGMWTDPVPVAGLVVMTLVLNLRHLLMGATLYPWLGKLRARHRYLSLFFMIDESWVLTLGHFHSGGRNAAFLLGSGLTLFTAWGTSTAIGRTLGSVVENPARWGIDFTFTAAFIFLLCSMWKARKTSLLPWLVSAALALVTSKLLPGKWYVLCGGLAGSFVGAWLERGRAAEAK